ncbi:5-formyltetrahydrofolate cyclo-ligase [Anaerobacillus arseniciselenatis]|uniref:5-formyltetrahydrofolate cyclo-ligase n=1 Tax=Anaerobacillus arseniciselenatis TaxID=85682 RepID=A0A1S2LXH8_9BACI|nr:5-formyltetrahydrofolate cyclo-ligase [Anaerobacillus arseniciselenatis]OIJ16095.1 5-formyltetrahydrofolate cyclo-ligase [Anaerobacillus arseniciselenatis]
MKPKKQLRDEMKRKLMQMNNEDYQIYSQQLQMKLLESKEWEEANTIGITISTNREVNTKPIIEAGWKQNKRIVVPKCYPSEKKLKFYEITSFDEVEDSFFSLKEPMVTITPLVEKNEIDLLVVPGLIFDQRGYRIGFGGGYYDRYLKEYVNNTVSLAFNFQLLDEIPKEEFDVPINRVIINT